MTQETHHNVLTGLKCRHPNCKFLCTKLGEMKRHASQNHGEKQNSISCNIKQTVDEKGVACLEEVEGEFISVIIINLQSADVSSFH